MEEVSQAVPFEAFTRLDLRVAEIKSAEKVEKSDKLLKLQVDLGPLGTRTVVAGIGKFYALEALPGTRCVIVANLVPRAVMGVESHGMVMCAKTDLGELALAICPTGSLGAKVS